MNVSQALDDVKVFLENDPLVQAAVGLVVPAPTRAVLADLLRALESEFGRAQVAAHEQGRLDEQTAQQQAVAEQIP